MDGVAFCYRSGTDYPSVPRQCRKKSAISWWSPDFLKMQNFVKNKLIIGRQEYFYVMVGINALIS
jgi:hypothetical protein